MSGAEAHIDLAAIGHNVALFRDLAADSELCAVVKADGYGHGAIDVAKAAVAAGASWIAVATIDEAVEIGRSDLSGDVPVLILSEQSPAALSAGWAELPSAIRLVVSTEAGARHIDSLARIPVPVHIKVDTGMHRVGVAPKEAVAMAELVTELPGVVLEGVWTHLAAADDPSDPFTSQQVELFDSVLTDLSDAGIHPPIVHIANSAGAMTRPDTHRGLIRVGIALYGAQALRQPQSQLQANVDLRPAMRLTSSVSALRTIEAGESVSYGRHWFAAAPTRIATIPVGYADGISRSSADAGVEALIGGKRRPMVGVVTMDQTMVVVDEQTSLDDEVVLIGTQGAEAITVDEIAERLDTIGYEVLVRLGPRITRRVMP